MQLRDGIELVLSGYINARQQTFTQHPIAKVLRTDLRQAVEALMGDVSGFVVKGSSGQGNWARGPWVGVFNSLVTSSAQNGYYVCYLFKEDMTGLYLSLNQGMTEAKQHYKSDAKTALRARAQNYRALLGAVGSSFDLIDIDLAPDSPSNDTAFYEAGNIVAKYYAAESLPSESELEEDIRTALGLYERLILAETASDVAFETEDDTPDGIHFEDAARFRLHKRIERNALLVKEVKRLKGCTCEICGISFSDVYGPIGANYIEAHHLKPISSIKGMRVEMNPRDDFAVLCSNCHRMLHRSGLVDDIESFKREHYRGRAKE
ncbi:DUF3578 domain-containing protein [Halopseudomonas aestusnigri]|uniref:MrcB family domain-containing protein n=1 Tax=Halopseudomonas aestusnigri TaxID=857252 RepID=UPI002557B677|nr:DUF3578 domain-containing protein [Halopseudomonas aestusnigri]MDL2199385.1 DUF3578 domain-containing protein [Halopseudomonas aestusnigri]